MSMSLDGCVAGPEVSLQHPLGVAGERLHQWLFADPSDERDARVAGGMFSPERVGAVLMGWQFTLGIGEWDAAGGKHVNVMGADVARQLLRAGHIDEIQISLVPVLLGDGVRLFDHIGVGLTELEQVTVLPTATVTHLHYRVLR